MANESDYDFPTIEAAQARFDAFQKPRPWLKCRIVPSQNQDGCYNIEIYSERTVVQEHNAWFFPGAKIGEHGIHEFGRLPKE